MVGRGFFQRYHHEGVLEPTTGLVYLHICRQHFRNTTEEHQSAVYILAGCQKNLYMPKELQFFKVKKVTQGAIDKDSVQKRRTKKI